MFSYCLLILLFLRFLSPCLTIFCSGIWIKLDIIYVSSLDVLTWVLFGMSATLGNSEKRLVDKIFHNDFVSFNLFLCIHFQCFQLIFGFRVFKFSIHVIHNGFEFFDLFLDEFFLIGNLSSDCFLNIGSNLFLHEVILLFNSLDFNQALFVLFIESC